jgi:hypothetical protein
MRSDYANDSELSDHLKESRSNLFDYFNKNYANSGTPSPSPPPTTVEPVSMVAGSPIHFIPKNMKSVQKTSQKLNPNWF